MSLKNIFNNSLKDITAEIPQDLTVNSITTDSVIIPPANPNDLLYINNNDQITGLAAGPNNYVLEISGGTPAWANVLNIDSITLNTLNINGIQKGDLLVGNATSGFDRLPVGTAGQIITNDGAGGLQWQDITFPDPLLLNDLQVNNNLNTFGVVNFNNGGPSADVSFAVPTFFTNNNISITAPNGGMYILNNSVVYLNQYTFAAPDTGAITGGVIGVTSSPWVMNPAVQYEASVSFSVQVGSTPFVKDQDIMIFQLRNGSTVIDECQYDVCVPFKPVYMRAFVTAASVSLQLQVSARPGSDASTTASLRGIKFKLVPTL